MFVYLGCSVAVSSVNVRPSWRRDASCNGQNNCSGCPHRLLQVIFNCDSTASATVDTHARRINFSSKTVIRRLSSSVMVWAVVFLHSKTDLIIIRGNLTTIRSTGRPYSCHFCPVLTIKLVDKVWSLWTTVHRYTQHMPHKNYYKTFNNLPGRLQIRFEYIEHLRDEMNRHVHRQAVQRQSLPELGQTLVQEWRSIPQRLLRNFAMSMRQRCIKVIQGHIGY